MFRRWMTLLWTARRQLKLTWTLMTDKRVPRWQKMIPFLPLVYVLSPFNALTFALPILGQVDDVMLFMMAMEVFERVVDKAIVSDYQEPKEVA